MGGMGITAVSFSATLRPVRAPGLQFRPLEGRVPSRGVHMVE